MEKNFLQLDQPGWWVLLIIIGSIGLTWYLYSIKNPAWSKTQNWLLSIIRFVAIFFILSLLLEPFINQTIIRTEKPIVAIALDNSQSIFARSADSIEFNNQLERLTQELENSGLEVRAFQLNDQDSIRFNQTTSDLSSLQQKIANNMEGRNWAATILFSDGVFNVGSSPIYKQYPAPQFTVGLGDTIPPRDINISNVLYNRVSFKGNETPIKVEVTQNGFEGQEISINLTENGTMVDQKKIRLTKEVQELDFIVKSESAGLRKMEISISNLEDDFILENNRASIFMEVIDGRQKILIVANAPHPDIKALKWVLSSTDNYEIDVYIPSLDRERPTDIYDVVIYHGAFSRQVSYTPKEKPGLWYILGPRSNLNVMNSSIPFLTIRKRGSQMDNVTVGFNPAFSKFNLPEKDISEGYPPISTPFGEYLLSGPTEVLLYQKVGSITTKKPLFLFFDDGSQKGAILTGQNFWKWKLQESAMNGNANLFDEMVTKTIQFLSVKNDKKQFQFKTRENNFSNLQAIQFDSEIYNDIYERIYGNMIALTITAKDGVNQNFEFIDSEYNSSFKVPALKSGIYTYNASASIGDKSFNDRGQFLVEEINKEFLSLTADHNLLKNLALRTGGEYTHYSNFDQVFGKLQSRNFKNVIKSSESYFPLIESNWMLFFILFLFTAEWLLRKYWGGY
jgi:hypothetical protein